YKIWETGEITSTQKLSEEDRCSLALVLSLKGHSDSEDILMRQLSEIENPDRRKKFEFLIPSVSADQEVRDSFFEKLKDPLNREREPWVIEGLGYLHHPIRASASVKYIRESLEMLEEVKQTGDIFFPANWVGTILSGHNSAEAYEIVRSFLESHPSYPDDLRLKILQTSDNLFRANESKRQTAL
ncbi:MAG: aminopeptidase, partial [Bacteroidales bacterium]|nr:aminopeptidase [Bacteroidales bacterium]